MRWACLAPWRHSLRAVLPTTCLFLHLIWCISSLTAAAGGQSPAFPPSMRHRLQVHQARQQARWHAAQAIKQQWQGAPQWTPSQQCQVDGSGSVACTQLGVRAAHWPRHGLSFCVNCTDPLHQGAFGTWLIARLAGPASWSVLRLVCSHLARRCTSTAAIWDAAHAEQDTPAVGGTCYCCAAACMPRLAACPTPAHAPCRRDCTAGPEPGARANPERSRRRHRARIPRSYHATPESPTCAGGWRCCAADHGRRAVQRRLELWSAGLGCRWCQPCPRRWRCQLEAHIHPCGHDQPRRWRAHLAPHEYHRHPSWRVGQAACHRAGTNSASQAAC